MSDSVPKSRRSLIFLNIIISCVASSLLSTALSTALPPIIDEFNVDITVGQWITSIYSLVMAIMIPMTAFLAKRVPTKRLYASVIALFLIGTMLCMMAPNIQLLLVGRALQAMGAGAITTVGQMVLLTIFPVAERGTIMGWYGLALGAAPVVAPTLGGILADTAGWRSIFALSFGIMLLSFIVSLCVFANALETERVHFDIYSFFLTALTFGGVTYGIGAMSGGFDALGCICLVLGAAAGVLFVRRQLRLPKPFLNVRVFTNYRFYIGVICSVMLYFLMVGPMTTIPMMIENSMQKTATIAGLTLLPGSVCSIIMNPIAGRLFDKIGARSICITGTVLMVLSMSIYGFTTDTTPLAVIATINAFRCIGTALMTMPLFTWAMSGLRQELNTDGTALFNALNQVASALGTAIFVGIMGATPGVTGFSYSCIFGAVVSVILLVLVIAFVRYRPGSVSVEGR